MAMNNRVKVTTFIGAHGGPVGCGTGRSCDSRWFHWNFSL